jgi:Domain of unknown function (DUF4189)
MNISKIGFFGLTLIGVAVLLTIVEPIDAVKAQTQCGQGEIQSGGTPEAGYVFCTPIEPEKPNTAPTGPTGPLFETRWGAIAFDNVHGKYAGVDNQTSKSRAEKAARRLCKANGGAECKVLIAYHDQCGVMASGDSYTTTQSGPDVNEAADQAVYRCSLKSANCKPYYAGCSPPEQVR